MKIQAHPGFPPTPSILMIADASKPEKAPDNEAVEKKSAILENNLISDGKKESGSGFEPQCKLFAGVKP